MAQIRQCSNNICITVKDIPVPEMGDDELLIRVKAAAVNPVDMLNLTGAVRLIQDDSMPLTLGNECAGIVEKAGRHVTRFQPGYRVYARLPVGSLGQMAVPTARRWVCASSSRRRSTMPCSGWRVHKRKSDSPSPIILSEMQRLEKSGCCFHIDTALSDHAWRISEYTICRLFAENWRCSLSRA